MNEDLIEYAYKQDGIAWRLMLRTDTGYVQVYKQSTDAKKNIKNKMELHATNMRAALDYIFRSYNKKNDPEIRFDQLVVIEPV